MKTTEEVFTNFQVWADKIIDHHGGKGIHYSLEEFNGFCPPYLGEDLGFGHGALPTVKGGNVRQDYVPFVIQQIREEIYEFVDVLLKHGKLNSMVEIGLGDYGGTRRLWIEMFENVYTVEPRHDLITRYLQNTPEDTHNKTVCAYSPDFDISTWEIQSFDFCFIDGDHTYNSAYRDYDKLEPYIKSGGIIGFHDSHDQGMGSAHFINTLRDKFDIKNIWHPEGFGGGISYYIKD